jgi:hypothetical protein
VEQVEFLEKGQTVVITLAKFQLVLTRAEFIKSIKRGKSLQRHEAIAKRLASQERAER